MSQAGPQQRDRSLSPKGEAINGPQRQLWENGCVYRFYASGSVSLPLGARPKPERPLVPARLSHRVTFFFPIQDAAEFDCVAVAVFFE